jgi:hypothetical protein
MNVVVIIACCCVEEIVEISAGRDEGCLSR